MTDQQRIEKLRADLDLAVEILVILREWLAPPGTPRSIAWGDDWIEAHKTKDKAIDDAASELLTHVLNVPHDQETARLLLKLAGALGREPLPEK